jgi:hypothetical protein
MFFGTLVLGDADDMCHAVYQFTSRESHSRVQLEDCRPLTVQNAEYILDFRYISQGFDTLGKNSALLGFYLTSKTENLLAAC